MKKRIDALTRLGKLQARMHDLGRWRLSAIAREQAGLIEDLRAVFEALESGELAYGVQAKLGARRVHGLQKKLDTLARESDAVREKAKAHGISAKLAEQAAETASRRYRDEKERKELADLIERAIVQRSASPT
jgi:hypothetical protein